MQVAGSPEVSSHVLTSDVLPQHPLVTIEADASGLLPNLREVWEYRELLYFLIWRDVKVRYKQTAVGIVWVVLQPVLMMVVFTVFFGRLGVRSDSDVPYPLLAYAGLLPWTFFSTSANSSANSLVGGAHLVTKVYFPRLIVPVASVAAILIDLGISFGVLTILMIYWQVAPTWNLLALPAFLILLLALALGFGILMSALNVKYRDVRVALPFLLQVWFFCSPIIYPVSFIPPSLRCVILLNPMTGIISGFRSSLYGRDAFDWLSISISMALIGLLLMYALFTFKRMEKGFADLI